MRSQVQVLLLFCLAAFASAFTAAPQPGAFIGTRVSAATVSQKMSGPAVLEPPTVAPKTVEKEDVDEKTKDESKYKKGGWAVRLFNDPMNKREFVAMCLSKITGLSDGQAYQVMMQAHRNGVSVVGRYDQERAELYRDSLRDNGLVVDMIEVED